MELVAHARLTARNEPWYRRPSTLILLGAFAFSASLVAWLGGYGTAAIISLALGAALLGTGVVLMLRSYRAARAEMVAMIDANLAARDASAGSGESPEDARKRAEVIALRDRLAGR
jgi:hypothetical protein